MAKFLKVPLDPSLHDDFFFAIRCKVDVIILIMRTIKYLITDVRVTRQENSNIYICVDDMNRFIYESEGKVFSIRSPFNFYKNNERVYFKDGSGIEIDSVMSSKLISFFSKQGVMNCDINDLDDYVSDVFYDSESVFPLILNLMSFEEGYLRFDNDPDNFKEGIHPLNHLDVCYSSSSTYKIGVYEEPSYDFMHDLLNLKVRSKFIEH